MPFTMHGANPSYCTSMILQNEAVVRNVLQIRRDSDLPCVCHLSGSQSVWQNRFLSIYTYRLNRGGGCPCVMEIAHVIALR